MSELVLQLNAIAISNVVNSVSRQQTKINLLVIYAYSFEQVIAYKHNYEIIIANVRVATNRRHFICNYLLMKWSTYNNCKKYI